MASGCYALLANVDQHKSQFGVELVCAVLADATPKSYGWAEIFGYVSTRRFVSVRTVGSDAVNVVSRSRMRNGNERPISVRSVTWLRAARGREIPCGADWRTCSPGTVSFWVSTCPGRRAARGWPRRASVAFSTASMVVRALVRRQSREDVIVWLALAGSLERERLAAGRVMVFDTTASPRARG